MKGPDQFARPHIEGANIAGRRTVSLVRRRTENQQILKYPSRSRRLDQADRCRIAIQALFQIDAPVLAKRGNRLARARIDRAEEVIAGEQEPSVVSVLALPIIDAAVRDDLVSGSGACVQISLPVAASSATMELFLARTYIARRATSGLKKYLLSSPVGVCPCDFQLMHIRR